jgi:cytochrome c oxidase assembly protein subunit 15
MNATVAISSAVSPVSGRKPGPLTRFAWILLAYNVLVILWGAAVRATGSGAGCGEHWPLCNGTLMQRFPTGASMIEFAHRASSGVALVAVIALAAWSWRAMPRWHLARFFAIAALVLTLNEALLGALLVLLGKVASDPSTSHAVYLALHLTNTLLMLGALALTAHFLSRREGFMRGSAELSHAGPAAAGLIAVILTGVTGALAALGDTLYPATSLRAALAQDFAAGSPWIVRIRWVHPAVSLLAGAFILILVAAGLRTAANRRLSLGLLALLLTQYALGVADITLLAPLSMQILHLLGADLLWIALVILTAKVCAVPLGCGAGACTLQQV